jgi:hypothetical protein
MVAVLTTPDPIGASILRCGEIHLFANPEAEVTRLIEG